MHASLVSDKLATPTRIHLRTHNDLEPSFDHTGIFCPSGRRTLSTEVWMNVDMAPTFSDHVTFKSWCLYY